MRIRRYGEAQTIPWLRIRKKQGVFGDADVPPGTGDKMSGGYPATTPSFVGSFTCGLKRHAVRLITLYGPRIPDLPA
jgi:hypothetical protein